VEVEVVDTRATAADARVSGDNTDPPTVVRATIAEASGMRNFLHIRYFTVPIGTTG